MYSCQDSVLISIDNVDMIYISSAIGLLAGCGHASGRASVSKMVSKEEAGRAMASIGLMQVSKIMEQVGL